MREADWLELEHQAADELLFLRDLVRWGLLSPEEFELEKRLLTLRYGVMLNGRQKHTKRGVRDDQ
ncbi:hypothetical protein [Thermosulfurimonas sp. F29]|uniref:hypothetical protein n=1 Tax=Thermosulfurimonas sp. F29 TaxID=2867247 RepID=UPI001C832567|nr:hypothetical protein [Thermosulfurimonas sp. F29]MBX6423793.1 hypothetical protein [Thermosulfurimonas sp. F29]